MRFRQARGDARRAIREAKNKWYKEKAEKAQSELWWETSMAMHQRYAIWEKGTNSTEKCDHLE